MFCKTCDTAAQKGHKVLPSNNFVATKGNTNFRLTTLARHEGGNEHGHLSGLLKIFPVNVPRPLVAAVERAETNDRLRHIPGVYTAFNTVYHLAVHERPLNSYSDEVRYVFSVF